VIDPHLAVVAALLVGLCVGSFLNVVVHRLPKMLERRWRADCADLAGQPAPDEPVYNLAVPRSACPACGHRITAAENIPLVSWLALSGRCRACKVRISARYPLVELLAGLLAAAAIWRFGATAQGLAACALLWTLLALTFIDVDTQYLPDDLTLPLLWGGLIANLAGLFVPLQEAVAGAIAGYLVLWSIYWLFKLIRGKEGMGYGDFKLLAALGAWLGWQALPMVIILSSLVGAVIGIAMILLLGRDKNVPIPFGPYLAIAGWIVLLWGETISNTLPL